MFAHNKRADQPAHPRRLISAFFIRFLESIISKLATSEISILLLVHVAEGTGLSLTLSETLKTGFGGEDPYGLDMRKPIFGVCDQVRLKSPC